MAQAGSQPTDFSQILPMVVGDAYANLTDREQAVAGGTYETSSADLQKPKAPSFPPLWTPRKPERFE
jgi:hypothetical protein